MLNDFVKDIITQYSSPSAEGVVRWNSRVNLAQETFEVVRKAFDLAEHRLSHLDCAGHDCYEEVEVKRKSDGSRYVQCPDCKKLDLINEDQDLAHKITLDGLANFLIRIMKIKPNKKLIEDGNIIYLGKKNEGVRKLALNLYLVRSVSGEKSLLKYRDSISETTPALVIKLHDDSWNDVGNLSQVWFCDLVFYNKESKKFLVHNENFSDSISEYLAEEIATVGARAINQNNKKYVAGGKKKAEENFGDAKQYVLKEYQRMKSKDLNKRDLARLIYKNFPAKTFPVILTEETMYRYILSAGKADK